MPEKKLLVLSIVFGAVFLVFVLKFALLMGRYGITASGKTCEKINDNETIAVTSTVSHEYIFTVVVYGILSILRILEYVLLGKQFYYFLFKQKLIDETTFFTKHSQRFCYIPVLFIVLLPYFLLGVIIPSLGIYQEIRHSERVAGCYRHYHEIYITYSVINFLRYMCAYTVRVVMIFTTLALSKYWFPDHNGPPAVTSSGNFSPPPNKQDIRDSDSDRRSEENPVREDTEEVSHCQDSGELKEILKDWKTVSVDYQKRAKEYVRIGNQVSEIQELFQTWFIIPWIVYFIASSLKTYNILRPWQTDGDGNEPTVDIPQIYYLLYNVNQFITLLIPFLCAKKMNTYHQKYHKISRDLQLYTFEENTSRFASARQLQIEKEGDYDFLPRIWGTSITINISSPLYVILLLAGLFLSVTESLL